MLAKNITKLSILGGTSLYVTDINRGPANDFLMWKSTYWIVHLLTENMST